MVPQPCYTDTSTSTGTIAKIETGNAMVKNPKPEDLLEAVSTLKEGHPGSALDPGIWDKNNSTLQALGGQVPFDTSNIEAPESSFSFKDAAAAVLSQEVQEALAIKSAGKKGAVGASGLPGRSPNNPSSGTGGSDEHQPPVSAEFDLEHERLSLRARETLDHASLIANIDSMLDAVAAVYTEAHAST